MGGKKKADGRTGGKREANGQMGRGLGFTANMWTRGWVGGLKREYWPYSQRLLDVTLQSKVQLPTDLT